MGPRVRRVALLQSAYFLATGLAPFASRQAFEAVTGPKREWWLVETVGGLVTAAGAGMAVAALRREAAPEAAVIGIGSAASLAAIDVVHHRRGRLRGVYLLDAAIESGFIAAWAAALVEDERARRAGGART